MRKNRCTKGSCCNGAKIASVYSSATGARRHFMTAPVFVTRRSFLIAGAAAMAGCAIPGLPGLAQTTQPTTRPNHRYLISVCDWMLLKRQKLGAIRWASECGCDGVEVDLGSVGQGPDLADNQLR